MRLLRLTATVAIVAAATLVAQGQQSGAARPSMSYDEFMKIEPSQRADRFRSMTGQEKAAIKRAHAQSWLSTNAGTLSPAQIAAVQEAIAFITPELYLNPDDPELTRRQDELTRKLSCVVGAEKAKAAFVVVRQSPSQRVGGAAWEVVVDRWLTWFTDCVIR